jgi:hypothetical protein
MDMAVCSLGVPDLSILILPARKPDRFGRLALIAKSPCNGRQTKAKNFLIGTYVSGRTPDLCTFFK